MYEHLRNELIEELSKEVDVDTINRIISRIDGVMNNYDISAKVTDLVPYEYQEPEVLKRYIACRNVEGFSVGTLKNYYIALRLFFNTLQKPLTTITTEDVRAYLNWYKNVRNISGASLDKLRQTLNAFFNWCVVEGYTDINPCTRVSKMKFENKEREPLESVEMEAVIDESKDCLERAIFETMYSTGCRVSELVNIKLSDYNEYTRQIKVLGKGKKERMVFVSDRAYLSIRKYLDTRNDKNKYLFCTSQYADRGKHICVATVRKKLHCAANDAHVIKPCTPHVIRHTTATVALSRGMPLQSIQIMLGHNCISTTEIYAKKDLSAIQQEHRKYLF